MFFFQSVKISFNVGTVSERWQKNGSFGFLSVGLCVGKNQMCHFVRLAFLSSVCSLIFALSSVL
jgi:hypothetical protein